VVATEAIANGSYINYLGVETVSTIRPD